MSRSVVIVGANRGIGLELVKCYAQANDKVVAICRKASEALQSLDVTVLEGLDVQADTYIDSLSTKLPLEKVDILIHNAGILEGDTLGSLDLDSLRRQFEVNSLGPLKTVLALKERLVAGAKVGLVSSRVGSIQDNSSGSNYGYRTSKAALNMIGKNLSHDLRQQEVCVALLHPGYVRTAMTGGGGHIEPDEAAKGLYARMEELNMENSGHFVHSSGESLTW